MLDILISDQNLGKTSTDALLVEGSKINPVGGLPKLLQDFRVLACRLIKNFSVFEIEEILVEFD